MRYITITLLIIVLLFLPNSVNAQMMRGITPVQQTNIVPSEQGLQDIQTGQELYNKFQSKQVTCSELKDADFEKIGEYLMDRSFGGNTNAHIQMNNNMKQMMGENAEEQMHIRLGENATQCNINKQGGGIPMMGWYSNMMGGNNGFSVFGSLIQIFVLVNLVLLSIWLWKKIKK